MTVHDPIYITTTIPYANSRPHLGFALELVQADVLARHYRRRGHPVRYQTGTDDNSLKNVLAATLGALIATCREVADHLGPFLPGASARIAAQCAGERLPAPVPLFPRLSLQDG